MSVTATTLSSLGLGLIDFVDDGVTDNLPAWNAWNAARPANPKLADIFFPIDRAGNYVFSGQAAAQMTGGKGLPGLSMRAPGSEMVVFNFPNGGGFAIENDQGNPFHLSGFSVQTGNTQGIGDGIAVTTANPLNVCCLQSTIQDVTVRSVNGQTPGVWSSAIKFVNQAQVAITDCFLTNANTGLLLAPTGNAGAGIIMRGGSIGAVNYGVYAGTYTQSLTLISVIFNGGTQVYIGPGTFQTTIIGCTFSGIIPGSGQASGHDIIIAGQPGNFAAGDVKLIGNTLYANEGYSGVYGQNVNSITDLGNLMIGFGDAKASDGFNIVSTIPGGRPSVIEGNPFDKLNHPVLLGAGTSGIRVVSNSWGDNTINMVTDLSPPGSNVVGGLSQ